MAGCKYCEEGYQKSERTMLENEFWFANFDKHPSGPGHMKMITKRHVEDFDELTDDEVIAFRRIYRDVKRLVKGKYRSDAHNAGWNKGEAAGQTVFHLHIHYIPRYKGDKNDPTGGVRDIITGKGNYLKSKP